MTDLSLLTVSLTKHNAHKLASLIRDYSVDEILEKLDQVHAERAQAIKNLSVGADGVVPAIWESAKALGDDAVDALLLVAIIFSHHLLINAMAKATGRSGFAGRIDRGTVLDDKAYTNFRRVVDQLGFATKLEYGSFSFDLRQMFEIGGLGSLVRELLELKLSSAKWNRSNSGIEEALKLKFNNVFGLTNSEFVAWLSSGTPPQAALPILLAKDQDFFEIATEDDPKATPFAFRNGHVERAVVPVGRAASRKTKANQLHNDLQNRLYLHLCDEVGEKNVGTEIDTGRGTLVDVVTKVGSVVTFY